MGRVKCIKMLTLIFLLLLAAAVLLYLIRPKLKMIMEDGDNLKAAQAEIAYVMDQQQDPGER